jgi:prophage maintenance system killer protein/rubrerythrin
MSTEDLKKLMADAKVDEGEAIIFYGNFSHALRKENMPDKAAIIEEIQKDEQRHMRILAGMGESWNGQKSGNPRSPNEDYIRQLAKKPLEELRKMQASNKAQMKTAHEEGKTDVLAELQVREEEYTRAIMKREWPEDFPGNPSGDKSTLKRFAEYCKKCSKEYPCETCEIVEATGIPSLYMAKTGDNPGSEAVHSILARRIKEEAVEWNDGSVAKFIEDCKGASGSPTFTTHYAGKRYPDGAVLVKCPRSGGAVKSTWFKNVPEAEITDMESKSGYWKRFAEKHGLATHEISGSPTTRGYEILKHFNENYLSEIHDKVSKMGDKKENCPEGKIGIRNPYTLRDITYSFQKGVEQQSGYTKLAALISADIAQAQPFTDCNHRTAFAMLNKVLNAFEYECYPPQEELEKMLEKVGHMQADKEEWEGWIIERMTPFQRAPPNRAEPNAPRIAAPLVKSASSDSRSNLSNSSSDIGKDMPSGNINPSSSTPATGYRVEWVTLPLGTWSRGETHPTQEKAQEQVERMVKQGYKREWVRIVPVESGNPGTPKVEYTINIDIHRDQIRSGFASEVMHRIGKELNLAHPYDWAWEQNGIVLKTKRAIDKNSEIQRELRSSGIEFWVHQFHIPEKQIDPSGNEYASSKIGSEYTIGPSDTPHEHRWGRYVVEKFITGKLTCAVIHYPPDGKRTIVQTFADIADAEKHMAWLRSEFPRKSNPGNPPEEKYTRKLPSGYVLKSKTVKATEMYKSGIVTHCFIIPKGQEPYDQIVKDRIASTCFTDVEHEIEVFRKSGYADKEIQDVIDELRYSKDLTHIKLPKPVSVEVEWAEYEGHSSAGNPGTPFTIGTPPRTWSFQLVKEWHQRRYPNGTLMSLNAWVKKFNDLGENAVLEMDGDGKRMWMDITGG